MEKRTNCRNGTKFGAIWFLVKDDAGNLKYWYWDHCWMLGLKLTASFGNTYFKYTKSTQLSPNCIKIVGIELNL